MYAEDRTTVIDRREMLKIKIRSLAYESKIIRQKEKRMRGALRDELHNHRVTELRSAARHTYLAYGFIRGRTYEQMEGTCCKWPPHWASVRSMIKKYGPVGFVEPKCMSFKEPMKQAA